ncbi:MAG: hypothetical protein KJ957_05210, partial [Candidatus Omnitrophica bacterium]|nr:hypothetical protein [Candidatus Omnitrophota bacterium]
DVKGGSFIVQNSDNLLKCRILQIKLDNELANKKAIDIHQKISLYEDESPILKYIQGQRQQFLKKYSIEEGDLRLFADPESKSVNLYYKDRNITRGHGLFSSLRLNPEDHKLSLDQDWEVVKINDNILKLFMRQDGVPQEEIFTFQMVRGCIFIKLEINSLSQFTLFDYYLKLEINENYNKWLTFYEESSFSDEEQCVEAIIPARIRENKVDAIILKSESETFPALNISSFFNPLRRILSLHKRKDRDAEAVCLQYQFSFFEDESKFNPGHHTIFEGSILIGERRLKPKTEPQHIMKLGNRNRGISFVFDRGKGRLIYDGRELTKGLGIYSSIRAKGIWHDSSQAIWRVKNKERNKLVVYGKWLFLPICQKWRIETIGNRVLWKVDTELFENIKLEIEQANVMVIDTYDEWILSNGLQGKFEEFYSKDYDILPFRFCYLPLKKPLIKINGNDLSSLSFKCNRKEGFKTLVENSDYFYRGRLLQYQKVNEEKLPAKYKFFEGEISVK